MLKCDAVALSYANAILVRCAVQVRCYCGVLFECDAVAVRCSSAMLRL